LSWINTIMIVEEIKNIKSDKKEHRQFGITIGILLSLLGVLFLWRDKDWYTYLFIISVVFIFFGLFIPILLKPIHKAWMTLAVLLGWFGTRVMLIFLFYWVVTPTALLAKLFGKDFLDTKFNRNVNSYWIPIQAIKHDKKNYEKQF